MRSAGRGSLAISNCHLNRRRPAAKLASLAFDCKRGWNTRLLATRDNLALIPFGTRTFVLLIWWHFLVPGGLRQLGVYLATCVQGDGVDCGVLDKGTG
jgi:hypothetical protein